MSSLYLSRLSAQERKFLELRLHASQGGRCFICEQPLDLQLHAGAVDIDHKVPTSQGGKDDPVNFVIGPKNWTTC